MQTGIEMMPFCFKASYFFGVTALTFASRLIFTIARFLAIGRFAAVSLAKRSLTTFINS